MSVRSWLFVAAGLIALAFFGGAQCAAKNRGTLEERARVADSTAKVNEQLAITERKRAQEEHARAEHEKARAESLTVVATSAGVEVRSRVKQAATARAAIPETTFTKLPASVQRALEEGDSLRVAVTPMIERYESALASYRSTVARLELTIARQDSALVADSTALVARTAEVKALEQLKGPRCGWRCGAIIGAGTALLIPHATDIVDGVLRLIGRKPAATSLPR